MSSEDAEQHCYFCVKPDENGQTSCKIDDNFDSITEWADQSLQEDNNKDEEGGTSGEGESVSSAGLKELLYKIGKTSEQQNEVISLINVIGPYLPNSMIDNSVLAYVRQNRVIVKSEDNYNIYRITEQDIPGIVKELSKASTVAHGLIQLPGAILLSMVGTFDSQLSEMVRLMLRVKSDKLKYGDKTMPLSRIMAASSVSELIEEAVSEEIYRFSRESHEDQLKYIDENFGVSIKKDWKRWPDLIEIFERRNLVAHGEVKFTKRYVDICKSHGHKGSEQTLNSRILVSISYLRQCRDILTECAMLTTFSVWRKHVKVEEESSFSVMLELAFNAIADGQYRLASYICEYVLTLKSSALKDAMRLRFVVNLASAHMHLNEEVAAQSVLDRIDWSATSDDFRICVSALRKDVQGVVSLMNVVVTTEKLSSTDFRTWPVFSFVREKQEFIEAFKSSFGEDFVINDFRIPSKARGTEESEVQEVGEGAEGTLH